ncbi:MAG: sulfotransferase, partial [Methylocella sp.]
GTQFTDWIRKRDRRMALEVDSSFLNYEILEVLLKEFPDARYILTIRDCYSWLDSLFNHSLRLKENKDPRWLKLPQIWPPSEPLMHAPEEYELKERGLGTLDRQFSWWTRRISTVLTKASAAQLLVVRTDEITNRAFEIADFCGLPSHAVRKDRSHAFFGSEKCGILRRIDRAFVETKVEKHCRELMTRFFPEIRSIDDARL